MKPNLLTHGEFLGEVLRAARFGELTLTETAYAPRCRLPLHAHERPYFCLVLAGSYVEEVEDAAEWACRPASVIFHPARVPHADRFEQGGGRCFNVELGKTWAYREADLPVQLDMPAHLSAGPASTLAARLHQELRRPDALSPLVVEGLVLALVAEVGRTQVRTTPRERTAPWLERCLNLLQARFPERLSLGEVAGAVGVHPAHLSRAFRAHRGCTVGEHIRRLRVEHARMVLETTEAGLAEVALAAGFSDQSHLSRAFKALVGTTPGRYRRSFRGF